MNTTAETLVLALVRAADRKHTVVMEYTKPGGETELRTVEAEDVRVTEAGDMVVVGWDRRRQDRRTFRTDRIGKYRVIRSKYTAAHRAFLAEEEMAALLSLLEPTPAPTTSAQYAAHGDWLAGEADKAEARGLADEAERLWELADLAWELAAV